MFILLNSCYSRSLADVFSRWDGNAVSVSSKILFLTFARILLKKVHTHLPHISHSLCQCPFLLCFQCRSSTMIFCHDKVDKVDKIKPNFFSIIPGDTTFMLFVLVGQADSPKCSVFKILGAKKGDGPVMVPL